MGYGEANQFVAYRSENGRHFMVWTIGGVQKDFVTWVAESGINHKTAGNRWRRLRTSKSWHDITENDLRDCLDSVRVRPGPPVGRPAKPRKGDPWVTHKGKPFVYDLNHLLALGCPVAIRAEFARRMAER